MQNFQKINLLVLNIFLLSIQVFAANWYVDKNATGGTYNGQSWGTAWRSFSAINWGSIQPGDVVYVSGGTNSTIYYEELIVGKSGTTANPITIIAGKYSPSPTGHSGRVIIDGGNGTRAQSIYVNNRNYITIKGFECRGGTSGVYIEDYANVIILDSLTIYDWYDLAGVFTNGAAPYTVDSVTIRNCSIVSFDYIDGQTDGIYSQFSSNTIIHNNYIRIRNQQPTAHVDCIQAHRSNGFIIYNNTIISDSVNSPEGGGMPIILGSEGNNPVIIYNNFMYMGGIWYPSGNYSTTCNLRWYDNPPMPPTLVAHNTIVSNGPRVYGMTFEYPGTCINNIVVQFGSGANYTWLVPMNNSTGSAIQVDNIRHNLIWKERTGGNDFGGSWTGNGSTQNDFDWSTWVNILGGTGVNANPLFVRSFGHEPNQGILNGELLAGSPAINQGENIQALIESFGLPWTDIYGNPRDNTPTIGAYEYDAGPDLTPPKVTGAALLDSVTLLINFSEALDEITAEDVNNYSITNNISILNSSLSGSKVTLQTSAHSPGSYLVTVINVKDLAGNPISPPDNTAEYIVLPPDNLTMFTVQNVEGVVIEPEHTPLKTIDGLGALGGDPDSRWAAEPMPEELIFDLGMNKTICKTKLSFYNWNAGRIYNYSISISGDHNNWITIVPQKSSNANVEWTIDEFPAVNARYVQVNFINNNQSNWAGLWEGEIWGIELITSVNDDLPSEFLLYQNYPNPFNPSTKISWQSPVGSEQTLKIYDILGNEVSTLVNEFMEAGNYEIEFNASTLPSGVYFYQLRAGDYLQTRKMLLLK